MSDQSPAKHTPGPWTVKRAKAPSDGEWDFAILDPQNEIIGEAFGRVSETEIRPACENAALMASAPDLLRQRDELADALGSRFALHLYTGHAVRAAVDGLSGLPEEADICRCADWAQTRYALSRAGGLP